MSKNGLEQVFTRWSQDDDFRNRFKASPEGVIREEGIDLSDDEWTTLHSMELQGLEDHHLKQRVSKSAFALGKLLGLGVEGAGLEAGLEGGSMEGSVEAGVDRGVEGVSVEGSAVAGSSVAGGSVEAGVDRGVESSAMAGGSVAGRSIEASVERGLEGSSMEGSAAEGAAVAGSVEAGVERGLEGTSPEAKLEDNDIDGRNKMV